MCCECWEQAQRQSRSGRSGAFGGYTRSSVMQQGPLASTDQGLVSGGTGNTYTGGWPLLETDQRSES